MTYTFTQTSHVLYDRHYYKLIYTNGKEKVFDDYLELKDHWFTSDSNNFSHVEVFDVHKQTKSKKGFK